MSQSLTRLLEPLIGQTLQMNGHRGKVIDIIEDPAALVIQSAAALPHLDCDYLGRTHEYNDASVTISLLSDSGAAIHPDLQRQLSPQLGQTLHAYLFAADEPF